MTASPIAQVTPQTAPRDLASLVRMGRYHIRILANSLDMFTSEQQKIAFMAESTERQAEHILQVLLAMDKGGGGPVQIQQSAPPQQQATPAGLNGSVPAQEQAAPRGFGKRQPRTQQQQAPMPQAQQPAAAPQGAAMQAAVNLGPIEATLANIRDALNVNAKIAQADKAEILGAINDLKNLVAVQTSLTLLVAENVLSAPREDILTSAVEDISAVLEHLASLGKGQK